MQHTEKTTTRSTTALSDNQIIALCKIAGITWVPRTPDGDDYMGPDECFPGRISMEQMRKLLNAHSTFTASAADLIAGQQAALERQYAARERVVEILHAATEASAQRESAIRDVLEVLGATATRATLSSATVSTPPVRAESLYDPQSQGFSDAQALREAMAARATRPDAADMRLESRMAVDAMSRGAAGDVELAASRWHAVLNSAYLRPLGNAGVSSPMPGNYAHLGLEMWTKVDAGNMDVSIENQRAIDWLTRYADIARAAQAEQHCNGILPSTGL